MILKHLQLYLFSCSLVASFQPQAFPLRPKTELSAMEITVNRRMAIQSTITNALAFLLYDKPASAETAKTIVITGANSGIGFEAAKKLAADGHRIVLACRSLEKALGAAERIKAATVASSSLIPAECDLASLKSIRKFASEIGNVDVLCLNAGVSMNTDDKDIKRTEDGFELTVGINHLGHFYLSDLLLPKMNKKSGRIVVTASGVHDPESPGGGVGKTASLGNLRGFEEEGPSFEMVDGAAYNGDKAYKDSKLCNVLFTRELQTRLLADDSTKSMKANSFSPGLITSTGFFRYQNPVFSKLFGVVATNIARVAETPEWGGLSLAYMATSPDTTTQGEYYISPPGSSKYGEAAFGKEFCVGPVSKEAQDDAKAKKLWELSARLVGLST